MPPRNIMRRSLFALVLTAPWRVSCTMVTNDTDIAADKTFDYIIAGAGLSGLTVGNKVCMPSLLSLV